MMGRVLVTVAMFNNASNEIQVVIEAASATPKRSGARSATRVVPTRPVSSPTMAKMKSVCASGSQPYFSI